MRVNALGVKGFAAFIAGSVLAGVASAAVIAPGTVDYPTSVGAPPSGTIVASVLLPFTTDPSGQVTGTVLSQVVSGDANNPHGGLTFVYQVANQQSSSHAISRLTASSFGNFITDVSYVIGAGVVPAFADRGVSGDPVGFSFHPAPLGQGAILPGQFSTMLIVRTNAPSYTRGTTSAIDGEVAHVSGFAPIPEPAMLSVIAGAGLLMLRRRR
jgi:hypothetical protein